MTYSNLDFLLFIVIVNFSIDMDMRFNGGIGVVEMFGVFVPDAS